MTTEHNTAAIKPSVPGQKEYRGVPIIPDVLVETVRFYKAELGGHVFEGPLDRVHDDIDQYFASEGRDATGSQAAEASKPDFNPADHRILAILRAGDIVLNHAFISHQPTRYYLRGVHVEPIADGGTLSVATDGYRLGVFRNPSGFAARRFTVRLPKHVLRKAEHRRDAYLVIFEPDLGQEDTEQYAQAIFTNTHPAAINSNIKTQISTTPFIVRLVPIHRFPNWRKAMPEAPKDTLPAQVFNPDLLQPFHQITGYVRLLPGNNGRRSAIIVDCGCDNFFGVLMPANRLVDGSKAGDPFTMPSWLGLPQPATAGIENVPGGSAP